MPPQRSGCRSKFSITQFISSSIRNKIIIPYAILTLIVAAFGTFVVTTLIVGSFRDSFENNLVESGRVVSGAVVGREEERLEVARAVVNTLGFAEAMKQEKWQGAGGENEELTVESVINGIMRNEQQIDSIVALDATGRARLEFQRSFTDTTQPPTVYRESNFDFSNSPIVQTVFSDSTARSKAVGIVRDTRSNQLIFYTVSPVSIRTVPDGEAEERVEITGIVLVGNYIGQELDYFSELSQAEIILFNASQEILNTTLPLSTDEVSTLEASMTLTRYLKIASTEPLSTTADNEQASGWFTQFAERVARIFARNDQDTETNQTILETLTVTQADGQPQEYRLAYGPFLLKSKVVGIFAVAKKTSIITEISRDSQIILGTVFTISVLMVMASGLAVAQQIIRPILRLVTTTQAIAKGDLNQRTGVQSSDEVGILATNFDLMTSELQKKTIELEKEASKLTAILSSIGDGVIVQDMAGQVIRQNPAAETILDNIASDIAKASHETETEFPRQDPLSYLLASLKDVPYLERQRLEIGSLVLSALSTPVLASDNEKLGSVVTLRDITQEVIAERLKDEFIQSVSHELKTPMFPLTGSISLIKMMLPMIQAQTPEKIYEKLTHNANVADEQANDIKNVVLAMVDLSEIDGDSFAINRAPMNLAEVADLVANDWYSPMEEKGLEFEVEMPDEAVWVDGDEEKLRKVIRTLLKNAHDYTLEGKVNLSIEQNNGQAKLTIQDTGVGILEKDQPYLFTRFKRAIHDKKTFELSGIGLGLYLSKVIVERQDGEIWMQSEPYNGSTFAFSLPTVPEPEESDDGWNDWDDDDWGDEPEPASSGILM